MTIELDVNQVLELMENGYSPEWACEAVSESHGEPRQGYYYQQLLIATMNIPCQGCGNVTEELFPDYKCHACSRYPQEESHDSVKYP